MCVLNEKRCKREKKMTDEYNEYNVYLLDSLAHLPDPNVIGINSLNVINKYEDLYKYCETDDDTFFLKYFFDYIDRVDDINRNIGSKDWNYFFQKFFFLL